MVNGKYYNIRICGTPHIGKYIEETNTLEVVGTRLTVHPNDRGLSIGDEIKTSVDEM